MIKSRIVEDCSKDGREQEVETAHSGSLLKEKLFTPREGKTYCIHTKIDIISGEKVYDPEC